MIGGKIRIGLDLRLTLEIFHNIKKPIVDVGLFGELNLDLIQIAKRVLKVVPVSNGLAKSQ